MVASNDRTGGKEKTIRLVDQGLMSGKSVVVDNTHVDKEARKPFMDLAKKHNVPVRCFLMTTAHDHARYEFYWDKVKCDIDDEYSVQTSLKWYSTIAVLSGTLAPAGTFLKNTDKIVLILCELCCFYANCEFFLMQIVLF